MTLPLVAPDGRPTICDLVYAVAVPSDDGRLAATFWARIAGGYGRPLTLVDWEIYQVAADVWRDLGDRVENFRRSCGARYGTAGPWIEGEALAQRAVASGLDDAKPIPTHVAAADAWPSLCLSVARFVEAGDVRIARPALDKTRAGGFAGLPRKHPGPRSTDPTAPAWVFGIVLGLDEFAAKPPPPARVKVVTI